jgi:hypothetical protein
MIRTKSGAFRKPIADCGCLQPQSAESALRTFYFSQAHTAGGALAKVEYE